MSMCDRCIHGEVCGLEDNHEEAMVYCENMIPIDVLDKIKAKIEKDALEDVDSSKFIFVNRVNKIIDKYKESEGD